MSTKSESACTKLNNSLAKSIDYNVSSINHALNCSLETNNTNEVANNYLMNVPSSYKIHESTTPNCSYTGKFTNNLTSTSTANVTSSFASDRLLARKIPHKQSVYPDSGSRTQILNVKIKNKSQKITNYSDGSSSKNKKGCGIGNLNNVRNALQKVRNGGSVAPKKKGALNNPYKSGTAYHIGAPVFGSGNRTYNHIIQQYLSHRKYLLESEMNKKTKNISKTDIKVQQVTESYTTTKPLTTTELENWEFVNYTNKSAFAAITNEKTVVTWGDSINGGDSDSVSIDLQNVTNIFSNESAFAALKEDGKVITWGNSNNGGDSSIVKDELNDVKTIFSSERAFAALKNDGNVVTWGNSNYGGDSSIVKGNLSTSDGVLLASISQNTINAQPDNYLVTPTSNTGNGSGAILNITINDDGVVTKVIVTHTGYGYSKDDVLTVDKSDISGSQVDLVFTLQSESVSDKLSNVKTIYSSERAFAALKNDGNVVIWGDSSYGGDSRQLLGNLSTSPGVLFNAITQNTKTANDGIYKNIPGYNNRYSGKGAILNITIENGNVTEVIVIEAGYGYLVGDIISIENYYYGGEGDTLKITLNDASISNKELKNIKYIISTQTAFAALKSDKSVVTWGDSKNGGDSSLVSSELINITNIYSTETAFAALKEDNSVVSIVSWGNASTTGQLNTSEDKLLNLIQPYNFTSDLKKNYTYNCDVNNVNSIGKNGKLTIKTNNFPTIEKIIVVNPGFGYAANDQIYFTVTLEDGSRGSISLILDKDSVTDLEVKDVNQIFATKEAFAALNSDENVYTWGDSDYGGDSSLVSSELINITNIYSTESAFAALNSDGNVITWGDSNYGGDSPDVSSELIITNIFSTSKAFVALDNNHTVVATWGDENSGGDSTDVLSELINIKNIYSTETSFAALKSDGNVVTWGEIKNDNDNEISNIKNISNGFNYYKGNYRYQKQKVDS